MNTDNKAPQKKPKPPKKITESYLQNSGLYYLQRFPASSAHFQFIMMRKIKKSIRHHNQPTIEQATALLNKVTTHFEDLGFLNDNLYATGLARSLFRKGMSEKMIANKLQHKGVPQDIIQDVLKEILPQDSELIAAARLLQRRRYGLFASTETKRDYQKSLGVLGRAGFSFQTSSAVLSLSRAELEDILSKIN